MSGPANNLKLTYAEYAEREAASQGKHQFLDGEIFAMAGGTPEHAALAMSVGATLVAQLAGKPCRVYSSDLRIRIPRTGLGTYPDVSVVCGPIARDPEDKNSLTNPVVLVEVLSDGTEAYDRGEKFEHYRSLASLKEYVIISHKKPLIERYSRNEDGGWIMTDARSGQRIDLVSIGCSLDVAAIYGDLLTK
jgi:Uma2 family endonuclease